MLNRKKDFGRAALRRKQNKLGGRMNPILEEEKKFVLYFFRKEPVQTDGRPERLLIDYEREFHIDPRTGLESRVFPKEKTGAKRGA